MSSNSSRSPNPDGDPGDRTAVVTYTYSADAPPLSAAVQHDLVKRLFVITRPDGSVER
jgi:hypothetical protein